MLPPGFGGVDAVDEQGIAQRVRRGTDEGRFLAL
jgi:hypothetical protein